MNTAGKIFAGGHPTKPASADRDTAVAEPSRSPAPLGATVPAAAAAPGSATGRKHSSRFRGDIEGLRALAVGLVLLYHAGLPFVPGGFAGVDVFFVISGFLITSHLAAELNRTGRISLAGFYARRAKRLLPAASVVLMTTVVLVWLFIPKTRWQEVGGDIVSSALYQVNWRLADRSVDYLAEDSMPSPVQHFWSLAVEEQYYLLWPLLILLSVLTAKMIRRRATSVLWVGLAVVVVSSFIWSLVETAYSPSRAFFETTTRAWELGVGAAVALGAGLCMRLPRIWAIGVGWIGLAAIVASGLFFSTDVQWPGYSAALPTIGAAAVIVAGFSVTSGGPASVLATRPFRWIGGLSYSLYLWHWPLLVIAVAHWGDLSPQSGLTVAAASIVPAWLTFRAIENPMRFSAAVSRSPRLALSLGANCTLAGVVAGLVLLTAAATSATDSDAATRQQALGAAALRDSPRNDLTGAPVDDVGWMTPVPTQATADVPQAYADGCQQDYEHADVITCEYGDRRGRISVAVVGDSKMTQWLPALQPLADQNGWRLYTYLKSSCSFSLAMPEVEGKPYETCRRWADAVLGRLVSDPPDYLVTTQFQGKARDRDGRRTQEAMVAGLRAIWSKLTSKGTKILVIADNPSPGLNVYECADKNPGKLSVCAYDRTRYDSSSAAPAQHEAVDGQAGVKIVDLFDAICPTQQCAPVIGNMLVYRQGSHLTATYVETLTPRLARALSTVGLRAAYRVSAPAED